MTGMKKLLKTMATIGVLILTLNMYGQSPMPDSLRFELLLTPAMVDNIHPEGKLTGSVEITPGKLLLLSSANQFYLLGWGGIVPMAGKVSGDIGSFAYTSDSLLMVIRNNELCTFGSDGNLTRLYTLPSADMGISPGRLVMYIYDRDPDKEKKSVFIIAHGGQYSKLFDVPSPVYSVAEMGDFIFFPNNNMVFRYNILNKEMKAIAALPEGIVIKSVVTDPVTGRIYFSTDNSVFSIKDKNISVINDKLGGVLRFFDGLIVYNPDKKVLVHISGLENAIEKAGKTKAPQTSAQGKKILTNQSVIDLKKNGLSDDLIITLIKRNKVDFNLSVDSVIEPSDSNISSEVIKSMRQAMQRQGDDNGNNR